MSEILAKKMAEISSKLDKLDAIEKKILKLDSIEDKTENFSTKLSEMEKSVQSLRCELNSSKEKQADLEHTADGLKEC